MATPAAILNILVTANTGKAQAQLMGVEKQMGHAEKRAHSLKAAAGAAGLVLGGALAIGAKAGFDELKQGQRVTAQTNAVLKSTGGTAKVTAKHVDALGNSILKKSGIDDEAVRSGENMLLTFTKVRNEVGKGNKIFDRTTQAIADMATAMNDGAVPSGEQLKRTAIQVGKALQDPVKGATALRRVGVALTAEQQDQIKTMVGLGNAADDLKQVGIQLTTKQKEQVITLGDQAAPLKAAADLNLKLSDAQRKTIQSMLDGTGQMKAQKVILRELNKEFGGSAAAAGKTLPGQLDILRETFKNLAASVVQALIPAMQALVGPMQTVADFLGAHHRLAKILTASLAGLAVVLGAVAVVEKAYVAATKLATAAQWAFNKAVVAGELTMTGWIGVLAAVGIAFVVAYKKIRVFHDAVDNTFRFIKSHWPQLAAILAGPFTAVGSVVVRHLGGIKDTVVGFINDIITLIDKLPFVNIPHIGGGSKTVGNPNIPHQKLAKGGFVNKPIAIMGEEAPAHPEWVVPTNPAYRKRAMGLWAAAGHDIGVPGFALGGAFGKAGSVVKSVTGLDLPSNPLKGTFLGKMGNWILHKAASYIAGKAGSVLSLPGKALKGIFGGSKGNFSTDGHPANIIKSFLPFIGLAHRDGLTVTSTTDGRHVDGSNHYTGHAVDFADGSGPMMKFARQALGFAPRLRELFYDPLGVYVKNGSIVKGAIGGHSDHVHLALARGGVFSAAAMAGLASQAGFSKASIPLAVAIALAESGGRANASNRNSDGSIDRGLWQINSVHGGLSTFNPLKNARAAFKISNHGRNWSPWTVYRTGAYKRFLGAAIGKGRGTKSKGRFGIVPTGSFGQVPGNPAVSYGGKAAKGDGFGFMPGVGPIVNGQPANLPSTFETPDAGSGEDPNQPLIDALNAAAAAEQALAEQQAALREEVKRWNDFSSSVAAVTSMQAVKALSDVISGQIVGVGYRGRALTASAGQTVRY